METLSVYDAKTHLSRLLDAVEAGEEILITRNGRPVARLVRAVAEPRRRFGTMKGVAGVADDFDAPLSVDDLDPTRGSELAALMGSEGARGTGL